MQKLEIKHIAPYLPYELKIQWYDENLCMNKICRLEWVHLPDEFIIVDSTNQADIDIAYIKPLLVPVEKQTLLSVFGEYTFDRYFKVLSNSNDYNSPTSVPYFCAVMLFERHFDVFSLIEKGLAIDKLTL